MTSDIKDAKLAPAGKRRIEWADKNMPVLQTVRERFRKQKPFRGLAISACLHVTAETANLMRTLKEGGARTALCASNPLSTQDDVAASLVRDFKIPVFARRGENRATFFTHIRQAIAHAPDVTMDDGADLVSTIHASYPALCKRLIGSMEETTTGVIRLRAMAHEGALKIPVVAVNDAKTKNLFDNRYGTGQSTLEGILRAAHVLVAGSTMVVAGYGWCGKGLARRAQGMGANVIVTEVDPVKALEAAMDGFRVLPMREAAAQGDVFCTVTGDVNVITKEHFTRMKDGAIVCNSGHFDVEVNVKALARMARAIRKGVRPDVDEYLIPTGRAYSAYRAGRRQAGKGKTKRIYVLSEGRLVNLSAAEGHPSSVMDMSFATQALACEWVVRQKGNLAPQVYDVPPEIEDTVSRLKLKAMGIRIDMLTPEQRRYLAAWQEGT